MVISLNYKLSQKNIGSYFPRLNSSINGYIDWSNPSFEIVNFINAFDDPYPGAATFINNRYENKVFIKSVQVHGGEPINHPFMRGLVTRKEKKWIIVSTSDRYSIIVEKVLNEQGKTSLIKIKQGDRFFTPHANLDFSLSFRAKYSPFG